MCFPFLLLSTCSLCFSTFVDNTSIRQDGEKVKGIRKELRKALSFRYQKSGRRNLVSSFYTCSGVLGRKERELPKM
jgi:hypothetical protein